MSLGPIADFTLDEARERARMARQFLKDGVDPLSPRTKLSPELVQSAHFGALMTAKQVGVAASINDKIKSEGGDPSFDRR
jgi:hypothetical protein